MDENDTTALPQNVWPFEPDKPTPPATEGDTPRGKPFAKGSSGNPHGRPPGARNKSTLAAQALLDARSEEIADRAITLALDGNALALKLCFERIVPRPREAAIAIDLPPVVTIDECNTAIATAIAAAAAGELSVAPSAGPRRPHQRSTPLYPGRGIHAPPRNPRDARVNRQDALDANRAANNYAHRARNSARCKFTTFTAKYSGGAAPVRGPCFEARSARTSA